jgi:hypothetical protein
MKQRAFLKSSSHLIDKMHSQWFADLTLFLSDVEDVERTLFRERDKLKDDERIDRMSENEAKKMTWNDNTNEKKKFWIWLKKSASQRISIEFEISFNKIFDMIANFFDVIENNDEKNDWIINDDSTNENVKKNDDETRSKEKSTKIVLWFFFSQSKTTSSKRKKERKLSFDFSFSLNAQRTMTTWWQQTLFNENRNSHLLFLFNFD